MLAEAHPRLARMFRNDPAAFRLAKVPGVDYAPFDSLRDCGRPAACGAGPGRSGNVAKAEHSKELVMNSMWGLVASLALAFVLAGFPPASHADIDEVEPNDTCQTAQEVGAITALPVTVRGELAPVDWEGWPPGDVDFYAFEADAGTRLEARLLGWYSGAGTLIDPFLGLFDSACGFLDYSDDAPGTLDSRLVFQVPEDGRFVLAATGCCDWNFDGVHWYEGSYALVIDVPPPAIGSVSGRLVDAFTGAPLSSFQEPFAFGALYRCHDLDCWDWVKDVQFDLDGRFELTTDWRGQPIEVGSFRLEIWASEYQSRSIGPFEVGADEHYDHGEIALSGPPVTFGTVVACDDLPSGGGTCRYSVMVHNQSPERLQGLAWSNVSASGTGSLLDWSSFTADRVNNVNIRSGGNTTLRFSFDVPAGVADGAFMCVDAWVSNREHAMLGVVRQQFLFCVQKQWGAFVTLDDATARRLLEHLPSSPAQGKRPGKRR
jgi:hypothetical protein